MLFIVVLRGYNGKYVAKTSDTYPETKIAKTNRNFCPTDEIPPCAICNVVLKCSLINNLKASIFFS